jgi:Cdc6-like AAA superfamily ATPase
MATPEQRAALHYSEEGHNILITGQCGTGKTFALKYDFHHHIIYITFIPLEKRGGLTYCHVNHRHSIKCRHQRLETDTLKTPNNQGYTLFYTYSGGHAKLI